MTEEQRIKALEIAIDELQSTTGHYYGRCVNAAIHDELDHPHWDQEWLRMRGLEL